MTKFSSRESGSPSHCLIYFAERGHFKGVRRSLERGARNLGEAIQSAATNGYISLIREVLWPLYEVESDKLEVVSFLTEQTDSGDSLIPPLVEFGLGKTVKINKLPLIEYFLEYIQSTNREVLEDELFRTIFKQLLQSLLEKATSSRIKTYLRSELRRLR